MGDNETRMAEEISAFDKFLQYLNPDRELAAQRYEKLRRSLITFFCSNRSFDPEGCADEALDTLQKQVAEGETFEEVERYGIGVARNVLLRDRSRRARFAETTDGSDITERLSIQSEVQTAERQADEDARDECMKTCLRALPDQDLRLLEQYYQGEKHDKGRREELAGQIKISAINLRVKVHRIREKLKEHLEDCLKKKFAGGVTKSPSGRDK